MYSKVTGAENQKEIKNPKSIDWVKCLSLVSQVDGKEGKACIGQWGAVVDG